MQDSPSLKLRMRTTDVGQLFDDVLSRAIVEVRDKGIDVYTFALYHDHESKAISVCVDTESQSRRLVLSQNEFAIKYFEKAVAKGDLDEAALWCANVGRSLSLGDFELVNVARTELGSVPVDKTFYLSMIRKLRSRENDIVRLASDPKRLLFCSSSADAEVGYVWATNSVANSLQDTTK